MSETEILPKKLNIFQKLRKRLFLTLLTPEKAERYNTLPEYLKIDDEVISRITLENPNLIDAIPLTKAIEILRQKGELIRNITNIEKVNGIINEVPEIVNNLEKNQIYELIYNSNMLQRK